MLVHELKEDGVIIDVKNLDGRCDPLQSSMTL